jgi:hypothetical protein
VQYRSHKDIEIVTDTSENKVLIDEKRALVFIYKWITATYISWFFIGFRSITKSTSSYDKVMSIS